MIILQVPTKQTRRLPMPFKNKHSGGGNLCEITRPHTPALPCSVSVACSRYPTARRSSRTRWSSSRCPRPSSRCPSGRLRRSYLVNTRNIRSFSPKHLKTNFFCTHPHQERRGPRRGRRRRSPPSPPSPADRRRTRVALAEETCAC